VTTGRRGRSGTFFAVAAASPKGAGPRAGAAATRSAAGGVTQAKLAERYGVKFQTISKIVRGDARTMQAGPTADYVERRSLGGGRH
jgi:helix-turn-helix protein